MVQKRKGTRVKRRGAKAPGKPVVNRSRKRARSTANSRGRARARKTHTSPQRYNQLAEGAYDFLNQTGDDRTLTASDRGSVRSLSIHSGRGRRRR